MIKYIKKRKLKIDFGSGYHPKSGYKTCDITFAPYLDYVYDRDTNTILGCKENSVDEFYLKNVLHHADIKMVSECLFRYLKNEGIITVIEPLPEKYESNRCLDIYWYRYIYPRYEYSIPSYNRQDYVSVFLDVFEIVSHTSNEIYDNYTFKKRG